MEQVVDTLGLGGTYRDPLWDVTVRLTGTERDLLRSWWVRRLQFVAHAGAASLVTTQNYSRLEHSLGVLALVAHFSPDDDVGRAAALVHDIGHLPFSHTAEGIGGLDHHRLGRERLRTLESIVIGRGIELDRLLAEVEGVENGPLASGHGFLTLDHLDSFVRSGRSHGRLREPPRDLLARLSLRRGAVSTDAGTARVIEDLVVAEARSQLSTVNVLATGLVRHWAGTVLGAASAQGRAVAAAMTDDEFWAVLRDDPRTGPDVREFRRDPSGWTVVRVGAAGTGYAVHRIHRLYLTHPHVEGRADSGGSPPTGFGDLPTPPVDHVIVRSR